MAFTTTYTSKFTGSTVAPANTSYNLIGTGGAPWPANNAVQLVWPIANQIGPYFSADTVELGTPTGTGAASVKLPQGNLVSVGQQISLVNTSQVVISVQSYGLSGTVIGNVQPLSTATVTLTDNTSAGGEWLFAVFSSTGQTFNPASLAGNGIKATPGVGSTTLLNTNWPHQLQTAAIIPNTVNSNIIEIRNQGTFTLPSLASLIGAPYRNGWYVGIKNTAGGNITIAPAGTDKIDNINQSTVIPNNGSAFFVATSESLSPDNMSWLLLSGSGSSGGGGSVAYSSRTFTMIGNQSVLPSNNTATFIDLIGSPQRVGNNPPELRVPAIDQLYIFRNLTTPNPQNIDGSVIIGVNASPQGDLVTIPNGGFTVVFTSTLTNSASAGFNYPIFPGGQSVIPGTGLESDPTLYFLNDSSTGFYSGNIDWSLGLAVNGIQATRAWDDLLNPVNGKHFEVGKPDNNTYNVSNYRRLQVYGDRQQAIFNYHSILGNAQFQNKLTSIGGVDGGVI